ncbi:MAG TPA: FHA domain-containing protein [Streptosporangiaceae bacterium]
MSSIPPPIPARREETLVPPEERQSGRSRRQPEEGTAFMCPHCEAVIIDRHATVCVQCLRPLRPEPLLRLAFPDGEVKIPVGQRLVLGRDAGQSPVAAAFVQYDNVSRRHATVSLDLAGQPRVRDEGSTNGTYVNDERIPPGVDIPLREGDSLRLAADVTGTVYLS